MTDITIRRAVASDAPMLAELGARTFTETYAADNSPEDLRAHLSESFGVARQTAELLDADVISLLAMLGDEPIGFAQVRRSVPPGCVAEGKPIELHRFYLAGTAHGQGVAAQLMREARVVALELGGEHLWLSVWERNPRALAFYAKAGFTRAGSSQFMVGSDSQTDCVLISPLQEGS